MSAPINDGGPAFPLGDFEWNEAQKQNNGMTLRDWFAGQALIGMIAMQANPLVGSRGVSVPDFQSKSDCEAFASAAFMMADSMLAARAKTP